MMRLRDSLWFGLAAALAAAPALAQENPCAAPGVLVLSDSTGDAAVAATAPVPESSVDIESLHMYEPAPGKLAFRYKMASLASVYPNLGWILRFSTETPPANGDQDFFVAMFSTAGGERFVHGTNGFTADAPAEPRQFRVAGDLDASSNYAADGTITLVLNKADVPDLGPGQDVFNILPTVRYMVIPAEDGLPFSTNGTNETILDDIPGSGFYEVAGTCSGSGKSRLGIGALGAPMLALLALAGLAGLRRRR